MSKEKKKEWNEKRAVQSPVYYQIKKILAPILLLFFIPFLTLILLIQHRYLDIIIIVNWVMIIIFEDYYYHPTAHKS